MNLLNKLTKKNLVLNKKRTIVTIVGIILSVALISALSSLVISFKHSLLQYEKTRSGDYHVSLTHVLSNDVEKLKNNRYIEDVYFSKDLGYSKLDGIKNEDKPFVFVRAYDFKALEKLTKLSLIEGRLPQTSNEIVIPRHLKTNGRVVLNIGDTIKLNIGKRMSDGFVLDQSNPYHEELESFKAEYEKEYKIVGVIERPGYSIEPFSAPGYTFVTCLDDTSESLYTAYVRYKHKYLKEPYYTTANILGVDKDIFKKGRTGLDFTSVEEYDNFMNLYETEMKKARYEVETFNSYLISLEYQNLSDSSMQAMYTVAGIVIIIIMVTSIYCIKNSFNISITEKTKQYGMLASIGATRKQIKKNVLYEAFVLGLIAIPIGILSGLLASFILIKVSSLLLGEALNIGLQFKVSIGAIILSILLGAVTIYLSAIKSARKASKISPISAIRNSDDIKIKSKKIKSPKIIKKLFGIGGDVSYKNLKRNSRKYRTTVISIVVCVSVFIALYSFMNLAFRAVDFQYKSTDYNISINYVMSKSDDVKLLNKNLLNVDGIKNYSVNRSVNYYLKDPKFSNKYTEFEGDVIKDVLENSMNNTWELNLLSVGDYQYRKYVQSLGLKYEEVKDKGILFNIAHVGVYDEKKDTYKTYEVNVFDYKKGDMLKGYTYIPDCTEKDTDKCYKETDIEVAFITDIEPFGGELLYHASNTLIVSDELIEKYITDNSHHEIILDVEDADKYQDDVEDLLTVADNYYLRNASKEKRESESLFTLVAIFLYGFIVVIALIGITNIFNTITTSVELRAREFATLKSVGMTKKEFNKMISLESIFYGSKSLIIGIPIGSALSYLIYSALVEGDMDFPYEYPIVAVIISILAVLILVTVIMKYSIGKIRKQNTIETIRNDNI